MVREKKKRRHITTMDHDHGETGGCGNVDYQIKTTTTHEKIKRRLTAEIPPPQIWKLDAPPARFAKRPVRGLQRQRQEQRGPRETTEPGAGRLRIWIRGKQQRRGGRQRCATPRRRQQRELQAGDAQLQVRFTTIPPPNHPPRRDYLLTVCPVCLGANTATRC